MAKIGIVRINKLQKSQLGAADSHNRRRVSTPNADPSKTNITRIGSKETIGELVAQRIKDAGAKPQKNSVHAVEIVCSASPSYFREGREFAAGEYDQKAMVAWGKAVEEFLVDRYRDNLVSLDVHLDEATPHIHAIVVPILEKQRKLRGKDEYRTVNSLCAKDMFDKTALQNLQTDYAKHLAPLGIVRGVRGSRAKHQTVKDFYGVLDGQAPNAPAPIQASTPTVEQAKSKAGLLTWAKEQLERFRNQQQMLLEHLAAAEGRARQYALNWKREQERTAHLLENYVEKGELAALSAEKDKTIQTLGSELKTQQEANKGLQFKVGAVEYENRILKDQIPKAPDPKGPALGR